MLLSMEYRLNPVVSTFLVPRLSNTKKIYLLALSTTVYEFQLAATSQLLHWLDDFRDFTVTSLRSVLWLALANMTPFLFGCV